MQTFSSKRHKSLSRIAGNMRVVAGRLVLITETFLAL